MVRIGRGYTYYTQVSNSSSMRSFMATTCLKTPAWKIFFGAPLRARFAIAAVRLSHSGTYCPILYAVALPRSTGKAVAGHSQLGFWVSRG
jgi:hypothetical protein